MSDMPIVCRLLHSQPKYQKQLNQLVESALMCWSQQWMIGQEHADVACCIVYSLPTGKYLKSKLSGGWIWLACDDNSLELVLRSGLDVSLQDNLSLSLLTDEFRALAVQAIIEFGRGLCDAFTYLESKFELSAESGLPKNIGSCYFFECGPLRGYLASDIFWPSIDASDVSYHGIKLALDVIKLNYDVFIPDVRLKFKELACLAPGLLIATDLPVNGELLLRNRQHGTHQINCLLGYYKNQRAITISSNFRGTKSMEKQNVQGLSLAEMPPKKLKNEADNINPDWLKDVEVSLDVRIGSVSLSATQLFGLTAGDVLVLSQQLDAPVEVVLKNNVIATGMLVAAGDYYGIELTRVASPQSDKAE